MKSIRAEDGNAILEGVSFAAVSFGLVLFSGLGLFQVQEDQLELQGLARNVMRDHSLHPELSLEEALHNWQSLSSSWNGRHISISLSCVNPCTAGAIKWLRLSGNELSALSFGIADG